MTSDQQPSITTDMTDDVIVAKEGEDLTINFTITGNVVVTFYKDD